MKKIILLIIISLSVINVSGQSYATCSTIPGELSGTSTDITVNQSTLAPVYTTTPSPVGTIPRNEFLIVRDNNLAYDNLGNAIISSSGTAVVTPSSLSLTTGDTFSIVSFSYDIQQFKLLTDGLLTNAIPFLGSCCSIVDNQSGISGFCTALSAVGITSGADVNTLEDVINIISIYNYGSVKSLSLAGLNNILNKLNTDITTYDGIGCTNALVGICYAFDTLSTKHDIYNVVVPTPYVNIPDANFKAALVATAAINTDSDSEISFAEADAFTGFISVNFKNISDLTGIEAFTNITNLSCQGNNLTSLDISSNTALTELQCQGNNLTSLDISSNTALTGLDCNSNSLTNFDISLNTSIRSLNCSNNNLTSLNLANGNNSNFNFLNTTGHPNLTCIQVDNVAYSTANWSVLFSNMDATASFSLACNSWTGAISNDWNTSGNWETNTVPSTTTDLTIPTGLTTYPTVSTAVTVNSITVAPAATLVANATITGNVTYTTNIANTNWHLMASPVSGATIATTIANNTLATGSINGGVTNIGLGFYDNNTTNLWSYANTATTGSYTSGEGFSLKLDASEDVIFTGTSVTNATTAIATGTQDDFNLLGNPFTAYVNAATFATANTASLAQETVWVWNGTSYDTYNNIFTTEIAPAQGFFVKAIANGNVVFNTTNQSHLSTANSSKQEAVPSFELFVENDTNKKGTKVFYVDNKSTGFDNGYDSSLFSGVMNDFEIYTQLLTNNNGEKLAIQSLPNENHSAMVVPVGIVAKAGKEITFSISTANLPNDAAIYLEDKVKGTFVSLSEETYKTTLDNDANGTGQFFIHTSSKSLSTEALSIVENVSIYKSSTQQITITGLEDEATVKVYSLLGKEVFVSKIVANGNNIVSLPNLNTGVYIVNLNTATGEVTKKIILE